jgi:hypothetical protein
MRPNPLARWTVLAGLPVLAGSILGCFRDPSVEKMKCLSECPSGYTCTIVDGVGRCCKPGDPSCGYRDAAAGETGVPGPIDASAIDALAGLDGTAGGLGEVSAEAGAATHVDLAVDSAGDGAADRPLGVDEGTDASNPEADVPLRDDVGPSTSDTGSDVPQATALDGPLGGAPGTGGATGAGGQTSAGGAGGGTTVGSGGSLGTGGLVGSGGAGTGGAVTGTGGAGTGGAVTGTGGAGTGGAVTGTGGAGTGGAVTGTGGAGTGGALTCPADRTCVASPPAGWSALGWLSTNPSTACGSGLTATSLYDAALRPTPQPAVCQCTCGSPVPRCTARLYCHASYCWDLTGKDWTINDQCFGLIPPAGGGASANQYSCGAQHLLASATCSALGQQTLPPYTWNPNAVTCTEDSSSASSCGAGHVCAATPPAGAAGPCVVAAGDVACPGAPYTERTVLHRQFVDARGCAFSCSCTNATASCSCTGTGGCGIALKESCSGSTFGTIPVINACQGVTGPAGAESWGSMLYGYTATATSECTPAGSGAATGNVSATEPQTICCMP